MLFFFSLLVFFFIFYGGLNSMVMQYMLMETFIWKYICFYWSWVYDGSVLNGPKGQSDIMETINGTNYSRMDQVKFVEDNL